MEPFLTRVRRHLEHNQIHQMTIYKGTVVEQSNCVVKLVLGRIDEGKCGDVDNDDFSHFFHHFFTKMVTKFNSRPQYASQSWSLSES